MPPRPKRSGPHDKSTSAHAPGLAPPARRVVKQKSSGALNGSNPSPNGRPKPTIVSPTLDAGININNSQSSTPSPTSDVPVNDTATDAKMGSSHSTQNGRPRTASSSSSSDDLEAHGSGNGNIEHTANGSPLKIDVKAAGSRCGLSNQKTALATAATILKACPLWDVIAILIILLQLPPTIVSVVQFLFAFLTFVSPTSGTSLANLPSINEVLLGASGAPSFQTIVFLDVLMLLPFVFLWTPAQNLALDLAQAVIAISLGGAASSKGGTSGSIFSCLFIIGLSHLIRWDVVRQSGFNFVWTGLVKSGLQPDVAPPPLPRFPDRLNASHGWSRKLVGVHILAQGLARLVRRWYLTNEMSSNKKMDQDGASLSALSTPRTTSSFGEPGADPFSSVSTDGRPPGPSPATREKDAISSNKRKKKQANFVRSQQPFWAALANAKVTFLKELEHQQASSDALEANAMDVVQIGNANFKSGRDRVWIKEVGSSEISFGVCLPSLASQDKEDYGDDSDHCVKRFRVRLNKTDWSSTRISEEALGVEVGEEKVDVWNGKIFGLTASTNYICEFVRVDDGALIFTTHITTQPAPYTEQKPVLAQPPAQSLRPLSPTTTLRNSIQAAESQLDGSRNRLKRNKRDHKHVLTGLQREVDSLNSRLSSNGGNDDRQKQKVRQLEQSIQQAKVKEGDILQQVEDLRDIPADEVEQSNAKRAEWQQEKNRRAAAQKQFDASREEADREANAIKSELSAILQRRQKFEQRQTKINEQRERLVSEASQSQEAQSRRFQQREIEARTREETARRYAEQTSLLEREAQTWWALGAQHENTGRQLEDLYSRNVQHPSMPTTPEGPLPGTRNVNHNAQPNTGFPGLQPGFQFSSMQAGGLPDAPIMPSRYSDPVSTLYRQGRGRSSSMLSGVSGFTDELDEYQPPNLGYYHAANGITGRESRKSSAGSGGSTSTGSSSARDPMSPLPNTVSPIAKSLNSPLSPPPTAMR